MWDEYYAIPVPSMNLAPRQMDLLRRIVVPGLRESLPDALAEMIEYPIDNKNLPSVKAAVNSFCAFPLPFRDDAWEQRRYYNLPQRTTITETRRVRLPDVRSVSEPLNTAPSWVKLYLAAQPLP